MRWRRSPSPGGWIDVLGQVEVVRRPRAAASAMRDGQVERRGTQDGEFAGEKVDQGRVVGDVDFRQAERRVRLHVLQLLPAAVGNA